MPLSKVEFRRRLVAGLALYGMELTDAKELLAPYKDLPVHHAERMGRESDPLVPEPDSATVLALERELGVPPGWFADEEWTMLVPGSRFRDRAADLGEARRAKNAASRAKQKSQKKSPGKQTSKERKLQDR